MYDTIRHFAPSDPLLIFFQTYLFSFAAFRRVEVHHSTSSSSCSPAPTAGNPTSHFLSRAFLASRSRTRASREAEGPGAWRSILEDPGVCSVYRVDSCMLTHQ